MANFIRNPKDFLSGLMFLGLGGGAILLGQDQEVGKAVRMGPGYFPLVLSGLLCLVGVACVLRSLLQDGTAPERLAWRPLLLVVTSTVVFGVLLRNAGLVAALTVSILISALASRQFSARGTALTMVLLTAFCYLVFLKGLGLPIPVLGPWLGG